MDKLGSRVTLDPEFQKSGFGVRLQGNSGSPKEKAEK